MDATERSISPVMMMRVIAKAMIMTSATSSMTKTKLRPLPNRLSMLLPTTTVRTTSSRTALSHVT